MDDSEQASIAAKQRMSNFRFRQSPPLPITTQNHSSHSRNGSTTNFPSKVSMNNNVTLIDESVSRDVPNSPSRSRPTSHHRRRSSVSTRRESAEMMGVAPPPDNDIDADGDPVEVRRRALWALEGGNRSDNIFIGGFTKVEIPELSNLENDPPKTKLPTLSSFGGMVGKRDSFGKLLSSSNSLKDQLHTLLEEEEEEEVSSPVGEETGNNRAETEVQKESFTYSTSVHEDSTFIPAVAFQPNRRRPTNLTLRPLSLTPESLPLNRAVEALPTPSLTPSPRMPGLKTLTLTTSPSSLSPSTTSARRQSLSTNRSPHPIAVERRQSFGGYTTPPQRKSSISYKRTDTTEQSPVYLPTPNATPTISLPPLHATLPTILPASSCEPGPDLDRPLSPTEQAFLFRSHTSLLCRISELENAIVGSRNQQFSTGFHNLSHERLESITSESTLSETDSMSSQPSDEMLQLVSHLKAERDELMRDIDGWRTRVGDLEKQIGMLTRRVEAERRESWVIRERLGVLEVEKKRIKEDMEQERLECRRLQKALCNEEGARKQAETERDMLRGMEETEREKREHAEQEAQNLQGEMKRLRERADRIEAELQIALVASRTAVPVRRYNSVDSQMSSSTVTDVEEYIPLGMRTHKLNAVEEEEEGHDLPRDITSDSEVGSESDHDELAHYEDEEEMDGMVFSDEDHTASSFGSFARTDSHLSRLNLAAIASEPLTTTASHARTGSMERGWSFNHARKVSPSNKNAPKVDHFFECLDALENDDGDNDVIHDTMPLPKFDGNLFWREAIVADDDSEGDLPPFVLPSVPSWKDVEGGKLEVVAEEEEEAIFNPTPATPTPKVTRRTLLPLPAPAMKAPPMTPKTTLDATYKSPQPLPSMIPHRTFSAMANPPAAVTSTTPPSPRAGSMIPRLSTSPKARPLVFSPPPTRPRSTTSSPGSSSRIPTPSKKPLTNSTVPHTQPQCTPLYIPQPGVVPRALLSLRA